MKIVSIMAVSADMLMGLAGGTNLLFQRQTDYASDICLLLPGIVGVIGHAGLAIGNIGLFLKGCLVAAASGLGWLWPQESKIFDSTSMQATVTLYASASISTFFAALQAQSIFILVGAFVYICTDAILYRVRKENLSAYTQPWEIIKLRL